MATHTPEFGPASTGLTAQARPTGPRWTRTCEHLFAGALGLGLSLACAAQKAPPKNVEEAADESWVTDAGAPEAKEVEPDEPAKASRPALKLRNSRLIETSVDYTGAVLIIDKAELVFPESAVAKGTVVHFAIAKRKGPARIGKSYEFAPPMSSVGAPFLLELPLPRGRKTANFAFSRTETKDGKERLVWDVLPPTRIDEERGLAVIELPELKEGWIHLTSKSP